MLDDKELRKESSIAGVYLFVCFRIMHAASQPLTLMHATPAPGGSIKTDPAKTRSERGGVPPLPLKMYGIIKRKYVLNLEENCEIGLRMGFASGAILSKHGKRCLFMY